MAEYGEKPPFGEIARGPIEASGEEKYSGYFGVSGISLRRDCFGALAAPSRLFLRIPRVRIP